MRLSQKFLSKYRYKETTPMTPLGEFVYYRTYSRFLPEKGRREYWWETCRRAVEYNCSIVDTSEEEAEKLFDNMYNLKQFLAGRTLWVGDTKSAKKFPMSNFNCFRRDTEFITRYGIKSFNDFEDGDEVDVLSSTGGWKTATVKNFGSRNLSKLTVRRGKRLDTIYVTDNHRWYVRKHKSEKRFVVKTTGELNKGDILRDKRRYEQTNIIPCNIGIQHGIVFGDGTYDKKMNHCRIHLVDEKQELSKFFTTGSQCTAGKYNQTVVYGLPNNWKQLPSLDSNVEYLMGFIMGLFSTDGSYCGSDISISNSDENILKHIKSILSIIGLDCGEISLNREISPFDESYSPSYRLNIYSYYIPELFFIRDKHIEEYKKHQPKELSWVVEEIIPTDLVEDVWCVVEPDTESFTLSNNILTKNCSFLTIDSIKSYCDMFYLLMLGSGVGFRTFKEDVEKLPKFRKGITLTHKPYNPIKKEDRKTDTAFTENRYFAELVVGDSKEGWVEALRIFLEVFSFDAKKRFKQLIINYNNVRPRGERLMTFGGTASGHESLMIMLDKIYQLLRSKKTDDFKLSTLDCLDVANMLAENVVSGGVRRSSQINLSEIEDKDVRDAKTNLFTQDDDGNWILDSTLSHRMKSNNSIGFKEKPSREELEEIFKSIRYSGEPGFINIEEAKRRFSPFVGTNPCGEILLPRNGLCNLVTVNVFSFVEDGKLNKKGLTDAFRLNARAAYRMTCLELELEDWNKVQKEHRLVGCSMTGWQDAMSVLNYDMKEQAKLLKELKETVKQSVREYSNMLGTKESKLSTTVKPEGSLSLLPTVSPGVHHSYSPYYIRRVRISSDDPLLKVCEDLGLTVLNEVGQEDKTCNTKVVEFYVKSPTNKTRNDVSAIEQLETYKMFMENYVEHNASNTITVRNNEWKQVIDWVYDNWDCIVGVTFLSLDDNYYPLMPYESISEDEYIAGYMDVTITPEMISKYEKTQGEPLDIGKDDECSGGSCPIR